MDPPTKNTSPTASPTKTMATPTPHHLHRTESCHQAGSSNGIKTHSDTTMSRQLLVARNGSLQTSVTAHQEICTTLVDLLQDSTTAMISELCMKAGTTLTAASMATRRRKIVTPA